MSENTTRTIKIPEGSGLAPIDNEPIPDDEPLPRFFIGYRGERQPDGAGKLYRIEEDNIGPEAKETKIEIPIEPSQALRHDADSFDWGNSGPGTAQTALAILIDFGCSDHGALAGPTIPQEDTQHGESLPVPLIRGSFIFFDRKHIKRIPTYNRYTIGN